MYVILLWEDIRLPIWWFAFFKKKKKQKNIWGGAAASASKFLADMLDFVECHFLKVLLQDGSTHSFIIIIFFFTQIAEVTFY